MKDYNVIGVMSGTSIDGLDLVYVKFFLKSLGSLKSFLQKLMNMIMNGKLF